MGGKFKKTANKRPLLLGGILALAGLLSVTGAMAAYRMEMQHQAEIISADFHISSNYLEADAPVYAVSDWAGGIEIEVYNYEKENIAMVAAEDITYEVSVSSEAFQVTEAAGTLEKGNPEADDLGRKSKILKLVPKDSSAAPGVVQVTLTTKTPFKKVLSASFQLTGTQLPVRTQTDYTTHQLVTITTGQYHQSITLTWPDTLAPDNTHALMSEWKNAASGNTSYTFQAEAFTTYELIFFGTGTVTMTLP